MTATETLVCPKCQGAMRTYERSGVTVDQCTDCRGIFLDHGELERLVYIATSAGVSAPEPGSTRPEDDDERERDGPRRNAGVPARDGQPPRRREGRFGGFLDILDGD